MYQKLESYLSMVAVRVKQTKAKWYSKLFALHTTVGTTEVLNTLYYLYGLNPQTMVQ